MVKGKRASGARWTAGCEADNLLQDIFDGAVLYKGRKLMEIPMEEFPQPIDVFNFFPEFHEVHSSAVFRTHWNNEKNARSSSAAGLFYLCSNTRLHLFRV